MSGGHALRQRGALLDELRQIVQAMKNLAFAELQRVARRQSAQAQARDAVLRALAELPRNDPAAPSRGERRPPGWLVIGAERGFCGAFNARLAAALAELRRDEPSLLALVASRRLVEALGDDDVLALPGCASGDEADDVLDAWLAAIAAAAPRCRQLWLLHAGESGPVRQRLLPPPQPARQDPHPTPALQLPAPRLRAAIERQALRLELHAALLDSLAQENHWRLAQMQRAQDHLDELGRALRRRQATMRQTDITNELETLMSGLPAADGER